MNFRPRKKNQVMMDVTPLVDVVFLLLIFFMVTTTFSLDRGIQLDLPAVDTAENAKADDQSWTVRILVDSRGDYFIQGAKVLPSQLEQTLLDVTQDRDDIIIIVQADKNSSHGSVVFLMDSARKLNLTRFSLITLDKSGDERGR
ncbi:MAG: biopolymer transporter ExbD [Magnetococcales bacterium]|nr:biopolymer transporter ExbD [Magnetococcales bacterium]